MTDQASGRDEKFDAWRCTPEDPKPDDIRSAFQHDRDRVLYSSAFRRLAGITQVVAVREQRLVHNRLTHSLKVAQIARRIAERLLAHDGFRSELTDAHTHLPDITETASLAHDIGHPPFGHIAEAVLNERMKRLGGFEGNAQSFRIVNKIAVRKNDPRGLNLTRASLDGILKYPRFRENTPTSNKHPSGMPIPVPDDTPSWTDRSRGEKWGVYWSERAQFQHARKRQDGSDPRDVRSVAAIIMDWADDISFATHDIDDYFRAGLIPLNELRDKSEQAIFLESVELDVGTKKWGDGAAFKQQLKMLAASLPLKKYSDSRRDRQAIGDFVTSQIHHLVKSIAPTLGYDPPYVEVDKLAQYRVELLKRMNFHYVINKPNLALAQAGQMKLIGQLFDTLTSLLDDGLAAHGKWLRVPASLREIYSEIQTLEAQRGCMTSDDERFGRAVCDYICTLTEDQAIDLYERLTGTQLSRASIFGAWFH